METKNIIIGNYTNVLMLMVGNFDNTVRTLTNDNIDENTAILRSLNVILEGIRSQITSIQNAIDTYGG